MLAMAVALICALLSAARDLPPGYCRSLRHDACYAMPYFRRRFTACDRRRHDDDRTRHEVDDGHEYRRVISQAYALH